MVYVKIRFHDNDDSCENDGHLDLQGDIKLRTKLKFIRNEGTDGVKGI